jgi:hypothetical protein
MSLSLNQSLDVSNIVRIMLVYIKMEALRSPRNYVQYSLWRWNCGLNFKFSTSRRTCQRMMTPPSASHVRI